MRKSRQEPLQVHVEHSLEWDPLLESAGIAVTAHDGLVALTGSVPNYDQLLRATGDAESVRGVTAVHNELVVGGGSGTIPDSEVATECAAALDAEKLVPKGAVSVEVQNCWVTLKGTVPSLHQRQAAKHAVKKVDGVVGVIDHVVTSEDPIPPTPSDVVKRVKKSLHRDAP